MAAAGVCPERSALWRLGRPDRQERRKASIEGWLGAPGSGNGIWAFRQAVADRLGLHVGRVGAGEDDGQRAQLVHGRDQERGDTDRATFSITITIPWAVPAERPGWSCACMPSDAVFAPCCAPAPGGDVAIGVDQALRLVHRTWGDTGESLILVARSSTPMWQTVQRLEDA